MPPLAAADIFFFTMQSKYVSLFCLSHKIDAFQTFGPVKSTGSTMLSIPPSIDICLLEGLKG